MKKDATPRVVAVARGVGNADGEGLELIVIIRGSGRSELAIHAMPMRDKYRRLLPGV